MTSIAPPFALEQTGHLRLAGPLSPRSVALHRDSPRWILLTKPEVGPSGEDGTDDWRNPEKPKLGESTTSDEDCWTCTPGRIDGGIGDRDADQMDEVNARPMAIPANPTGARRGGAQDDDKTYRSSQSRRRARQKVNSHLENGLHSRWPQIRFERHQTPLCLWR